MNHVGHSNGSVKFWFVARVSSVQYSRVVHVHIFFDVVDRYISTWFVVYVLNSMVQVSNWFSGLFVVVSTNIHNIAHLSSGYLFVKSAAFVCGKKAITSFS
jgi:hypothetical protein